MIIGAQGIGKLLPGERRWENDQYEVCWKGFLFLPGTPAGPESLESFAQLCATDGLAAARRQLKGHYCLAIRRKPTGLWRVFIDAGGMFYAFYTPRAVATSFLDLVRSEDLGAGDLDADALVEFLTLGYVFQQQTLFRSIRRLGPDEILSIAGDGVVHSDPDVIGRIDQSPGTDPVEFFLRLPASIARETLSVDLTGGVDSRLVAVLLHHSGLAFETSTAGRDSHPDVRIAREVAAALGHPHYLSVHTVDDLESDLPAVFRACDGLFDVFSHHRIWQHRTRQAARGVTLAFGGLGGELFKETHWVHDLPFYRRRTTDLDRLTRLRLLKTTFDGRLLAERFRPASSQIRRRWVERLEAYRQPLNTQTYDCIAYHHGNTAEDGRAISNSASVLPLYCPLDELDLVRFGFALPRRRRFFDNYHRQVVTDLNPAVARIPTPQSGLTCSARPLDLTLDAGRFAWNNLRWGADVFARLYMGRSQRSTSANHPDLLPKARTLALTNRAIERLKQADVLARDVGVDALTPSYLGRCVTLGLLLDKDFGQ